LIFTATVCPQKATAYLKANYPIEFMTALLASEKNNSDKISDYISESIRMGIEVLPPDVNESYQDFTVTKAGQIRFGLAAVKNVGEAAVKNIIEAREEEGPFTGIYNFTSRIDSRRANKRVLESLVKCGAFDSFNENRAALLAAVESAMEQSSREQADRDAGQASMFDLLGGAAKETSEPTLPDIEPWPKSENLRNEKEALGFFITGHPLDHYHTYIERFSTCDTEKMKLKTDPDEIRIAAVITSLERRTTKAGKPMATGLAEDQKSPFKIMMFAEALEQSREALEDLDQPFLLFGKVDVREGGNGVLVDRIIPLVQAAKLCSNEVHFNINALGLAKSQLERLKACIQRHPGSCRVFIHITIPDRSEASFALPTRIGLEPSDDLISEAKAIFGSGVVTMK